MQFNVDIFNFKTIIYIFTLLLSTIDQDNRKKIPKQQQQKLEMKRKKFHSKNA